MANKLQISIFFEDTVTAKDDKKDKKVETCEKEVALKQPSRVLKPTPTRDPRIVQSFKHQTTVQN